MKNFGSVCYAIGIVTAIGGGLSVGVTHQGGMTKGADTCYEISAASPQCNKLATTCTSTYKEVYESKHGAWTLVKEEGNQCGGSGCTVTKKTLETGCDAG